jgi:hypothetical protein
MPSTKPLLAAGMLAVALSSAPVEAATPSSTSRPPVPPAVNVWQNTPRTGTSSTGVQSVTTRPAPAVPAAPAKGELCCLFVGNSFTYCNGLPSMVSALFAARKTSAAVDQHAVGAATLGQHAANPQVAQKIAGARWTHVVLQDQSAQPATNPEATLQAGKTLCELVRKDGAVPVFFLTWAYRNQDGKGMETEMQESLSVAYAAAAKETNAVLAPVGPAWQAVLAKDPKAPLYAEDGQHPSAEGTYLAACVFYAALSGKTPVGLPARLTVVSNGRMFLLADIPAARAKLYQQTAWETVGTVTAETILAAHAKKEAALPSLDDAKAKLRKNMPLEAVIQALGRQPSQRNDGNKTYIFQLRDGASLWLTYGADGAITRCTVSSERGPWINLDLP